VRARLTQHLIRTAPPKPKPYEIRDTETRGLILRIQPSGVRTFYVEWGRGLRVRLGRADVLTPSQARSRALAILAHAANGDDPRARVRTDPSLGEYVGGEYRAWCMAHTKTGAKDPDRLVARFAGFLDLRLSEVTPPRVEAWTLQRLQAGRSPYTVRRDIATLHSALAKAVRWRHIAVNPLEGLAPIKGADNTRVRYLDAEERSRFMAALEASPIRDLVMVALHTGMRRGELFGLRWEDVDLGRRLITVTAQTAKSRKVRHIPANELVWRILGGGGAAASGSGYVFCSPATGAPLRDIAGPWMRLCREAQVSGFRFHDCRHDFASRLVMAGIDLNTVRELLGHADLKMTLRYAHLAPAHKASAVAVLVDGR
jgi:integrase